MHGDWWMQYWFDTCEEATVCLPLSICSFRFLPFCFVFSLPVSVLRIVTLLYAETDTHRLHVVDVTCWYRFSAVRWIFKAVEHCASTTLHVSSGSEPQWLRLGFIFFVLVLRRMKFGADIRFACIAVWCYMCEFSEIVHVYSSSYVQTVAAIHILHEILCPWLLAVVRCLLQTDKKYIYELLCHDLSPPVLQ